MSQLHLKSLLLLVAALGCVLCAPQLTNERIIGGRTVDISVYPHQVRLQVKNILMPNNSYSHSCGGVILDEHTIVTAAHCTIARVPSQMKVVAGSNWRRGMDGVILPIKEIVMHEKYVPNTYDNDIALLFLDTPLPLNNFNIKAIDFNEEEPRAGAIATVTGWGSIGGGVPSETLQEVKLPIVSNKDCDAAYGGGRITDSMLCAGVLGVGGKDSCQGDSGGPLLVNGKLAGIVSWGTGCALPDYPGVYARISYLLPWLKAKIEEHHSQALL